MAGVWLTFRSNRGGSGSHQPPSVDADDMVTTLDESAGEDAAAAPEIDYGAIPMPTGGQLANKPLGRITGNAAVAGIVDVGKIFAICGQADIDVCNAV